MMSNSRPAVDPRIIVFIGVFFTSFAAIFTRMSTAPSLAIAAYRMIFSVLLVVPLLVRDAARRRSSPSGRAGVKVIALCVLAGVFLALHFAAWISSLSYTTIASSTVLVSTSPVFVLAFAFLFLGERVPRIAFLYMLLAIGGAAVLSLADASRGGHSLTGDLLALGGALSVSGYVLIGRVVRSYLSVTQYVSIVYTVSAVVLVLLCVVFGVQLVHYSWKEFLIFLGMAFFCTMLGHTIFNWALGYLKASFVSTATIAEPVYATLLGVVIFREMPGIVTILGGVVVLVSLAAFTRVESRAAAEMLGSKGSDPTDGDTVRDGLTTEDCPPNKEL